MEDTVNEIYLGCECWCLNHVVHFMYDNCDCDDEDVIYITVPAKNLFNRVYPSLASLCWDWDSYIRFNFLNRISIALKYLVNKNYVKEYGIFDCADFQNKDLASLDNFLNNLDSKKTKNNLKSTIYIDNEEWRLRFAIGRIVPEMPYQLGWDIQFTPRNFINRLKYSFKYIFGTQSEQQGFEINKEIASQLKGMIEVVNFANKENNK